MALANISTELKKISTAVYGRDMRTAIHDSIEAVNNADITLDKLNSALQSTIDGKANKTDIVKVDSELSGTSANPVQNKIVKEALDAKAAKSDLHAHTNKAVLDTITELDITPRVTSYSDLTTLVDNCKAWQGMIVYVVSRDQFYAYGADGWTEIPRDFDCILRKGYVSDQKNLDATTATGLYYVFNPGGCGLPDSGEGYLRVELVLDGSEYCQQIYFAYDGGIWQRHKDLSVSDAEWSEWVPLSRIRVVERFSDLTSSDSTIIPYEGMVVYCKDRECLHLYAKGEPFDSDALNWIEIPTEYTSYQYIEAIANQEKLDKTTTKGYYEIYFDIDGISGSGDGVLWVNDIEDCYQQTLFSYGGNIFQRHKSVEAGVLADDVEWSDWICLTTIYTGSSPATTTVGGLTKGTSLTNKTLSEILEAILCPYVAPTITAILVNASGSALSVLEKGTTVSGAQVKVTLTLGSTDLYSMYVYSDSAYKTKIGGFESDTALDAGPWYPASFTLSESQNNPVYVIVESASQKSNTISFVYPYYYGAIAATGDVTADMVTSTTHSDNTGDTNSTKYVSAKSTKAFSYKASNKRMMFAYPKGYGKLSKITDPNGFNCIDDFTCSEVSITGLDKTTQTYYVYVSGATTVSNFKMTFSY